MDTAFARLTMIKYRQIGDVTRKSLVKSEIKLIALTGWADQKKMTPSYFDKAIFCSFYGCILMDFRVRFSRKLKTF